jgi:2-keto-4-pentenoate hydratase/2-oxohepta-3-ene-1,7-dioic acid hydratase in catechol pathway
MKIAVYWWGGRREVGMLSDDGSGVASSDDAWRTVSTKAPECVLGPREAISLPRGISDQIDYEAELAVVIGRGGTNIRASRAMEHVWGYTVVEDVTARDVPGDFIATGTPAGVGMGRTPPVFLKAGDVDRIEIDRIGTLENPVQ